MPQPSNRTTSFQSQFHQRWNHLTDPHVRALAWLLDAPDLLNPDAPQWQGKIATLTADTGKNADEWLIALDAAPATLHAFINVQPFSRLGRYAEKLMAFYFQDQRSLVAHGVQVRAGKADTVGEFDFLLRHGDALVHWEFATKFYLLQSDHVSRNIVQQADYFVGPNLADTLGAKMRKILDRQLALAQHPAAQIHLPQAVDLAQALIKGWLFYRETDLPPARSSGVADAHCRGFWCTLSELDERHADQYIVLPRLSWLAPAKVASKNTLTRQSLQNMLAIYFAQDTMPVMVARLEQRGNHALEIERGFIVPDDWGKRAEERIRGAVIARN